MDIRTGAYNDRVEELRAEVESLRTQINSQLSSLPPAIDPKLLSDFLVDVRIKVLEEECPRSSISLPSVPSPSSSSNPIVEKALQVLKEYDKEGKARLICCYTSGSHLHGNDGTVDSFFLVVHLLHMHCL